MSMNMDELQVALAETEDDLADARAELAALQREHERLREAAELFWHDRYNGRSAMKLRAALDSTQPTLAQPCEADYKCSPGYPCRVHMPQPARKWTCAACGGQCETECASEPRL